MYRNGLNIKSATNTTSLITGIFAIGKQGDNSYKFNGSISDTRIYNRTFSESEINTIFLKEKSLYGL